jgi:hypothetical protein
VLPQSLESAWIIAISGRGGGGGAHDVVAIDGLKKSGRAKKNHLQFWY